MPASLSQLRKHNSRFVFNCRRTIGRQTPDAFVCRLNFSPKSPLSAPGNRPERSMMAPRPQVHVLHTGPASAAARSTPVTEESPRCRCSERLTAEGRFQTLRNNRLAPAFRPKAIKLSSTKVRTCHVSLDSITRAVSIGIHA